QGSNVDNHQQELGAFFETVDKWLAFYEDVRVLVVKKQLELRLELPSPAAASRGKTGGVVGSPDLPERLPAVYPAWLSILLECYRIERKGVSTGEDSARSEASGAFPAALHHPADSCRGCETNGDDGGRAEPERGLQQASLDNADSGAKDVDRTTTSMGPKKTESKITPISTAAAEEGLVVERAETMRDANEKGATGGRAPEWAGPPMDSLVRFSRYLALLVASAQEEQTPSANEDERSALAELVRAR
ncbi:unnamed protein product, partial [Ectocarpus fasciculatus]